MRIVSFIVAVLLVLAGGGCTAVWISDGLRTAGTEMLALFAGFGLLPLIGGVLLFRYAWRDRGGGSGDA